MPQAPATQALAAAREHLRRADPVLARLIDEHPEFDPRAWMAELPPMDAFGALLFQIVGQQLSVSATRAIVLRLQRHFGGHLPAPREILAAELDALRNTGLSRRKIETLRALAQRFAAGELTDQVFLERSDEEIEAMLTAIPGSGPWTVHGFLIIALDRPDVVLPGDLALRRAVRDVYRRDQMPTEQEVVQIAERWRPYRSLAVSYLFASEFET
jgi:DNA-3-methyladenine glycosylase II